MNEKIEKAVIQSNLQSIVDSAYLDRDDWRPVVEEFARLLIAECAMTADENFDRGFAPVGNHILDKFEMNQKEAYELVRTPVKYY